MFKLVGLVAGVLVFGAWMGWLSRPNVLEEMVGGIMALAVGVGVWFTLEKISHRFGAKKKRHLHGRRESGGR